jgi:hypothetical protein
MSIELLTYTDLGARLNVSPEAARGLDQTTAVAALAVAPWQSGGSR